jgi:DNA replication protein DnaC
MDPSSEKSVQELVDHYCNVKHLIVDDIGAGMSGSDFGMKELEEIVVYRYHNHLFTLMTTNKDISGLPERVVSRFNDKEFARIVLNEGSDYRLKK